MTTRVFRFLKCGRFFGSRYVLGEPGKVGEQVIAACIRRNKIETLSLNHFPVPVSIQNLEELIIRIEPDYWGATTEPRSDGWAMRTSSFLKSSFSRTGYPN